MKTAGSFCTLIFVLLLSACSVLQVHRVSPDDLSNNGLLVGTFATKVGRTSTIQLVIDGETYNVPVHAGTFTVALPPGNHVLETLIREGGGGGYAPMGVQFAGGRTFYPIKKSFNISTGSITSLGAMYFATSRLLGKQDSQNRYTILHIDNDQLMQRYLTRYQSDVYRALTDKTIHKADYEFLNKAKLHSLRELIAKDMVQPFNGKPRVENANSEFFITTILGTAGWVATDENGFPKEYTPLPLDTLERVISCETTTARYACLSAMHWSDKDIARQVIVYSRGKQQHLSLPDDANPFSFHLFADDGVTIGDFDYKTYTRTSEHSDWEIHEVSGVKGGFLEAKYRYANADGGFYTYFDGNEHLLTFTDYETGKTQTMDLPADFGGGQKIVSTKSALLIGPETNVFAKSNVYRRDSNGHWSKIELPLKHCIDLFEDGDKLVILCAGKPKQRLESVDLGTSWTSTELVARE